MSCPPFLKVIQPFSKIFLYSKTGSFEIGNPNCFNVSVYIECKIPNLTCIVNPKEFILKSREIKTVNITVEGYKPNVTYKGKIYVYYRYSNLNTVVTYDIFVKIKEKANTVSIGFLPILLLMLLFLIFYKL